MKTNEFLPLAKPSVSEDEINAVKEVLESGWWTTGPKVLEFQEKFAFFLGNDVSALALNSCTSALFLALKASGIKEGDEVLVPALTFIATAQVVEWCGARPVLVDIDPKTLNICPRDLEKRITSKTRAVIPVHIAGYPVEMDEIMKIAKSYSLLVIEDAAHAIGTKYNGVSAGTIGDYGCFSFYATKNLACGEGGMIVSRDLAKIERVSRLSYFGINKQAFHRYSEKGSWYYEVEETGYKCNFDNIHAAIGLVQLKKIDEMNKRRTEIAAYYDKAFGHVIDLFDYQACHTHARHLYPVRLPDSMSRDEVIRKLREKSIGSSVHFIPLHQHPWWKKSYGETRMENTDRIYPQLLSLPLFPAMTELDCERVVESFLEIVTG